MKRMLSLLFILILVLSACQEGFESRIEAKRSSSKTSLPAINNNTPTDLETVPADVSSSTKISAGDISRIRIKDISAVLETEYVNQNLIKEFCSLLENQKYTGIDKVSGEAYKVDLFDLSGKVVLTAAFNDNTVYFDHSIAIGNIVLSKGAYEANDWSWASFSFYLKQLCEGIIMDPENIQYPANISIPASSDDIYKLELVDRGNERVNSYDVYPMLYDLINSSFSGNSFEIISSKKFYDYEELQSEIDRTKKENQCILLTFGSSDTRLQISSRSTYKEFSMVYCLTIAKKPQEPGIYKLITDKMVFDIKVNSNFSDRFDALFTENEKADKQVTPDEIKTLFNSKKPYYMEYICKNLGIDEWVGREPDRLEIGKMKLNSESKPYTVVSIYSTFSLRMLVYKQNSADNSLSFIGDMDFRGWPNSPEYRLEKTGDQIWVAGTKYMGHGTGESRNSQQWYRVADTEVKSVLLFSFDDYSEGPYGGYCVKAKKVSVQKAGSVKVKVDYDTAKRYNLFLDIADEYGSVELKGSKTVEFVWDEKQEKFISEYKADEDGAFSILADSPEITKKCDELLEKHYMELVEIVSTIPKEKNEYERACRAGSIKTFLNDCSDCPVKAELLKKLTEISPENLTY